MNEQAGSLIDIIEPVAPLVTAPSGLLWLAALAGLLLTLLLVLFMLWKKKWPAYRALKRVRTLKLQTQAGELPPQKCIYLLAQELRHGLGLAVLQAQNTPARFLEKDRGLWPIFIQHLDTLRYQTEEDLTYTKLSPLFNQTESWLRQYSR